MRDARVQGTPTPEGRLCQDSCEHHLPWLHISPVLPMFSVTLWPVQVARGWEALAEALGGVLVAEATSSPSADMPQCWFRRVPYLALPLLTPLLALWTGHLKGTPCQGHSCRNPIISIGLGFEVG